MPLTVPDDINYPDTDYAGGFVPAMALMATSVQDALDGRQGQTFVWDDQADRDAETGMGNGDTGYQLDTSRRYSYNGSSWVGFESRPHIEFTATSASVAASTTSSVGTLTLDATRSNVGTIGGIVANALTLSESGIYAIDFSGSIPASPTGSFFVQVSDGTSSYKINGTTSSGTLGGALVANYFAATAGVVLTFTFFHVSAANRVLTSRIAITRIAS